MHKDKKSGGEHTNYNSHHAEPHSSHHYPSARPHKKTNWVLISLISSVIFLVFIIFLVLIIIILLNPVIKINSSDLAIGKTLDVKENQKVLFKINNVEQSVIIDSLETNSVTLTVQSISATRILNVGNESKFDLNNNGIYDLYIRLIRINNKKAEIHFKKISEKICAGQSEEYFFDESLNPNECCEGLVDVLNTELISINDECYETGIASNIAGGVCSNCGNGICEDVESVCSCPEDCAGKNLSDFNNTWDFCESEDYLTYCTEDNLEELELCGLCIFYEVLNKFNIIGDFCGIVDSNFLDDIDTDYLISQELVVCEECEESDALVCLGNNFFNDCKSSSILMFDEEKPTSSLLLSINKNNTICESILTFGNYSDDEDLSGTFGSLNNPLPYSNIICPMEMFQNATEQNQTVKSFFQENKGTWGVNLVGGIFSFLLADLFSLIFTGQTSICKGSFYDSIVEGVECFTYLDCLGDYDENTIGYCNFSRNCEAIPFVGECRNDSQCTGVCANCSQGFNKTCLVDYIINFTTGDVIHNSSCVDCTSNEHCKEGFICDRTQNKCILGTRCEDDDECTNNEYCEHRYDYCISKSQIGEECDTWRDSCLNGICIDKVCVAENFFNTFTSCTGFSPCIETCTNCIDGNYTCNYVYNRHFSGQICVECSSNYHCNENYECKAYSCVQKS